MNYENIISNNKQGPTPKRTIYISVKAKFIIAITFSILWVLFSIYLSKDWIKDLASVINFSEHYFMKFFKKYMGITCIDYINDYRLNIATNLLETTDIQVMEIANKVGISNVSYFNRIFKKKFNLTPKEYRKNLKNIRMED